MTGVARPAAFGSAGLDAGDGSATAATSQPGPPLRGLCATRDVQPGEVVLSLPASQLISYDTATTSDLVRLESGRVARRYGART
jgi:hypothetical protein